MATTRVIQGSRRVQPHAYPPGTAPDRWVPGDVVLTHSTHGWRRHLIELAARATYRSPDDRPFVWFTHAAVVVSPDPDTGEPRLVEAVGEGIRLVPATAYEPAWFAYVDIGADDDDRHQIVEFAEREADLHGQYGVLQAVSIGASLVTQGRVRFGMDGSEICSALVAKALRGAGYWWERDGRIVDESYLTPADLAAGFHTETIRTAPAAPRTLLAAAAG